ncbi:hypothetical protein ONS95_009533 [Cadophora gregata]|uniref:uncharacterized protein n=1 Tax=Cadophora gregata TaxID=51156 RepID=UPI0026DBAC9D|nr:uncharacterized protein ONS95_009533 [Cadophora gregata]KAK0124584.1 hypothetical protein ONS95_009533 [Cadophora gregata]KAK0129559.1 hypothetical protein ONS96_000125 [Cadophora gregata f. sp. sojae]
MKSSGRLISNLQQWLSAQKLKSETCPLCFSDFIEIDLRWACVQPECLQKICKGCLSGWYGMNAAGKIINTAALSCPYCRGDPMATTLAKYGKGIHAVGNLQTAVEENSE